MIFLLQPVWQLGLAFTGGMLFILFIGYCANEVAAHRKKKAIDKAVKQAARERIEYAKN